MLILLINLLLIIFIVYKYLKELGEIEAKIMATAVFFSISSLIYIVICEGLLKTEKIGDKYLEYVEVESYNIEALNDNTNIINGKFYIGTGNISNQDYFYFYKNDSGYFHLNKLDARFCKIKYSKNAPKIIKYKKRIKTETYMKWILINATYPIYVFEIPEGSIYNNYKLDLE